MEDYIDELEVVETLYSPDAVYIVETPPDDFPIVPWIVVFDKRSDPQYPTIHAYRIGVIVKEQFITDQYGDDYFVQSLHVEIYDEDENQLFSGQVHVDVEYEIKYNEIVIRFTEINLLGLRDGLDVKIRYLIAVI